LKVKTYSEYLFNRLTATKTYKVERSRPDLFSLLDDQDCEDIVYVYLQTRGYIVFPSRRRPDTPAYEYVLVHKAKGYEAIAQVRTGDVEIPVDLASWPQPVSRVYVFSPNEKYKGKPAKKVRLLTRRTVTAFMRSHRRLLPPTVRMWMEIAGVPK
jgi:hypothetical protein